MAVIIKNVKKRSPFYKKIKGGDSIISINGNEICDIFDYQFYSAPFDVQIVKFGLSDGTEKEIILKKPCEDFGLEFESYLMDKERSCRNNCMFCFIDQLPKGLRDTLYFKDDDSRLSFLFGNYITLTNLSESDVKKICDMHLSPINISVHTTDPELRCKMMGNRFAGDALRHIKTFKDAGIRMNFQLVLCRGVNDGDVLRKSISDLAAFSPQVESISCVPAGITDHRKGLPEIISYDKESSREIIDIIEEMGTIFLEKYGSRLVYPSDEFFITAEKSIPPYEYYENFSGLENGVGMVQLFIHDFIEEMKKKNTYKRKHCSLATGVLFAPILEGLINAFNAKFGCEIKVYPIKNKLFGEKITVAGLVSGSDIIDELKDKSIKGPLFIPENMLKAGTELFLDDVTVKNVKSALKVKVLPVKTGGADLAKALFR